jgi:1-acyl-sn-glycerol-3-phosphate acyltransferase
MVFELRRKQEVYDFWEPITHAALHTYYRVRYSGIENIPTWGPAFVVPKHQSYLDIIFEGILLKRYCGRYGNWVMRDAIPLPQDLLHNLGGVTIRRPGDAKKIEDKEERRKFLEKAKEMNKNAMDYVEWLFNEGEIVVAHLEGTRTRGKVGPLRKELFDFAAEIEKKYDIDIPIIPVGIEYERLWVPFSGIYVRAGKPIKADTENIAEVVRKEIARLSNL